MKQNNSRPVCSLAGRCHDVTKSQATGVAVFRSYFPSCCYARLISGARRCDHVTPSAEVDGVQETAKDSFV